MTYPIKNPPRASRVLFSAMLRRGSRGGFTFVELILVVALIAIATAVAIPQFKRSFDHLLLRNFVSDFTALAGYAQAKAVSNGCRVRVSFDLPRKALLAETRLVYEGPSGEQVEEWRADRSKAIPDTVAVTLKEDKKEGNITFYPDGSSDKAEFEISGKAGGKYSVTVEEGTGYVNVKETE